MLEGARRHIVAYGCMLVLCVCCMLAASPDKAYARTPSAGEFYYMQLSPDEQAFYDALLAQSDDFLIDANPDIRVSTNAAAGVDPARVTRAFFLDHPELFWVDPARIVFVEESGQALDGVRTYALSPSESYFRAGIDADDAVGMKQRFDRRVQAATAGLNGSPADKAASIVAWLHAFNGFDIPAYLGGSASSAYAALATPPASQSADGFGYAAALKVLLDAAGIPNAIVQSIDAESFGGADVRAWNVVRIAGSYYGIDALWGAFASDAASSPAFLAGSSTVLGRSTLAVSTFASTHGAMSTSVSRFGLVAPALSASSYCPPGSVAIDGNTFPDEAFRNWLLDPRNAFGAGADGVLTPSEAGSVTSIDVSESGISSLEGIDVFTELRSLDCSGNSIAALDLSGSRELTSLDCSDNALTRLDLSAQVYLDAASLCASGNALDSIQLPRSCSGRLPLEAYAEQRSPEGYLAPIWYEGSDAGALVEGDIDVSGQRVVAVREPVRYRVAFDGGPATGAMDEMTLAYGDEMKVPPCGFKRDGYRFAGWVIDLGDSSESADPGDILSGLSADDGAVVRLIAQWAPIGYTVAFDGNGVDVPAPADSSDEERQWPESRSVAYDEPIVLPDFTETVAGKRLAGWSETQDASTHIFVPGSDASNLSDREGASVQLYAVWSEDPLETVRSHAVAELDAAYGQCDPEEYTVSGRNSLEQAYGTALSAIRSSVTPSAVDAALSGGVQAVLDVQTKGQSVASSTDSWRAAHEDVLSLPVAHATDMDAIVAAINSSSQLSGDKEVQQAIDAALAPEVEELTEKREVAAAKILRLDTLRSIYDAYDLSSMTGEGASSVTSAYQSGVRSIDAAPSVADVETATESARIALSKAAAKASGRADSTEVAGQDEASHGAGSADEGSEAAGAGLSDSGFFLLLFLIVGITALCVVYANVRDRRRARKR